jgi:ribosome biogenesis GTPase
MEIQSGIVTKGINNIYTVVSEDDLLTLNQAHSFECRIKGKVLDEQESSYNPIAVGDKVEFIAHHHNEGRIIARKERTNSFMRWNAKRENNQVLVANVDRIYIITSSDEPPFRPRFLDRAIVCAQGAPITIVLNKNDLPMKEEQLERFMLYEELGYETMSINAFNEKDIASLSERLKGTISAFIGQSGVGKSTLTNHLIGGEVEQKVGDISTKYNRGRHTTNYAVMLDGGGFTLVDTPGMRELLVPHTDEYTISTYFPEFTTYAQHCSFQRCVHIHEPECAVKEALQHGAIHPDRYESYFRMIASLELRPQTWESR